MAKKKQTLEELKAQLAEIAGKHAVLNAEASALRHLEWDLAKAVRKEITGKDTDEELY